MNVATNWRQRDARNELPQAMQCVCCVSTHLLCGEGTVQFLYGGHEGLGHLDLSGVDATLTSYMEWIECTLGVPVTVTVGTHASQVKN